MDRHGSPGAAGFLAVGGGSLYYEVEGSGEALVLIHGGLGNLRMWDFQAQALAGDYRVVRCDLRGFGRSTTEHVEFAYWADVAGPTSSASRLEDRSRSISRWLGRIARPR